MTSDADIVFDVQGPLACVLLNRPKALNALTHEMAVALDNKLKVWESDPRIAALVIRGQGSRAFCAGGDIRKLYDEGRAGSRYPFDFYHDEYRCNARIHRFPKPYVSFLDGIVMGGGVGVSVHGSHRIATENTVFAMPETGIGLFPDVGGSYFLSRLPGALGMFLGLTGTRLKAADAICAGVAQFHVPSSALDALQVDLAKSEPGHREAVSLVIRRHATDPGAPSIAQHRATIDRAFGQPSVEAILEALDAEEDAFAAGLAAQIRTKSPTSLKITHRQIREGAKRNFDECMRMEWRMVNRVIRGHDFYEGTRAVVVDKDQKPAWRPPTLDGVHAADVDAYFAPLGKDELRYDWD
ncbi:MAG TPA: enoyl-CoA hydratase/isomerase family protein [Candidatus Cybelea sp.]|nr:enoyl-CoA hydratase/isomerase family protein [Candidatus Cybelea sp.]